MVPVPRLEDFVRARTGHYDRDYLSTDPGFTHAHITALGPFLEDVDEPAAEVIAGIVGNISPFEFTLSELATFPNGIIHLVPDPVGPFRELTRRLVEAFPQCPPYAGQFREVRPHLTLDQRSDAISEASTLALLGDVLPARCVAERLELVWYEAGHCHLIRSWVLGPGNPGSVRVR
jgi:2'-5' RNA ligase